MFNFSTGIENVTHLKNRTEMVHLSVGQHMGKARDFKTFPQATYQKINFSLDLFLQLYFKILKQLFLVLRN